MLEEGREGDRKLEGGKDWVGGWKETKTEEWIGRPEEYLIYLFSAWLAPSMSLRHISKFMN